MQRAEQIWGIKKKKKSWIKKGSVEGLKEEVELLLQKGVMGSRREKIRK